MTIATSNVSAKVVAVVAAFALVASVLAISAPAAKADTTSDLQAQIAALQAQLSASQGTSMTSSCSFTRDLTVGSKGADVTCLQNALKAQGYMTASATGYFGGLSKAAVIKWQVAAHVSPAAGYFGAKSRAAFGGSMTPGPTPTPGPVSGTGLKVMLSATSPNNTVLVQGQGIGNLADFTFTNPSSAPIAVKSLSFKRIGVSNDSTLNNVYLYNGVTRITDSAGVNASAFRFTDPVAIFTVPAGGSMTISVRSDILTSTSGQQIGVQLIAVGTSGTLDSSVSFPINGYMQTVSAANLATVSFNATTLPSTGSISPTNDYPVWQNTVAVSINPVWLKALKLTNLGSIDAANIQNLRLYVDGTMVGSAAGALAADRTVTFDLSAAPVSLSTSSHVIKVIANVTGGASRTFAFSVQRSSDALFYDSQLSQPVTPTVGSGNFTAVTSGPITINSVSGSSGVSVTRDPQSPTNDVPVGATNVKLASFDLLPSGENVKINDLYVFVTNTDGGTTGLNNGKVFVNGMQVGSTKDLGEGSGNVTDFSLGSSLILPAGQTTVVDIYGDAQNAAGVNLATGKTILITLGAGTSNAQGQSSLNSVNVPNSATAGNTISVTSSALTATKYSGYGNQTMLAGTNNARVGSFTLSAGSTEGVNVNTVVLNITNPANVTNLTLKDNATGAVIGTPISTPAASGNSYSVTVAIPASGTKTIDVYANIVSGASSTSVVTVSTSTTGTGAVTSTTASVASPVSLQTITVGSGTFSAATSANNPVAANVIAGVSSVKAGSFTFSAANSAYTVTKLLVKIPANAATSVTNVTLQYKDASGAIQTATQALSLSSGVQQYATATFTGLTMYVPQNDSADIDVYVGTATVASGASSGADISVVLDSTNSFQAVNAAGAQTTSFSGGDLNAGSSASYGNLIVRKSVPTVAMQAVTSTIPTSGQALYRFNVTADAAGTVEVYKVGFTVATTTVSATSFTLYDVTGGQSTALNASPVNSNSSNVVAITPTNVISVGAGQTKTFELRAATVSGWGSGAQLTISLTPDSSLVANAAASSVSGNFVWSDRSATSHTTSTTDWTSGYLLKDFVNDVTQFVYHS